MQLLAANEDRRSASRSELCIHLLPDIAGFHGISRGSVGFRWTTPSSVGPPKNYLNPQPLPRILPFFLLSSIFLSSHQSTTTAFLATRQRSTVSLGRPSPTPLVHNSFAHAESDSRTSNTCFGAMGGPTTPIPPQHAPLPFRHTTSLADLSSVTTRTPRALQSNQPGASYVLNLPTWRRGPKSTVPARSQRAASESRLGTRTEVGVGGALLPVLSSV